MRTNRPLVNYHYKLYNLPYNMNIFCQIKGIINVGIV